MKKNLGMFLGLPRRGARAVLPALFTFTAACVLSVSSAQAAILLDWQNGTLNTGTQDANVTTTTVNFPPATKSSTGADITTLNGQSFTVQIAVNGDNTIPDLQIQFTLALANLTSIKVSDGNGNTSSALVNSGSAIFILPPLSAGGSLSETLTLNTAFGGDGLNPSTVTFSDIQFQGTVTPVPEPVNYALAGFGLLFVGVGAGRFYLGRRRLATAS